MDRNEFVATVTKTLDEIQQGLYDRALQLRTENTREINSLDKFKKYFTAKNQDNPEIHGGFAMCHFVDCPEVDEICKDLKVTIRCIPLENQNGDQESGRCIFTGKESKGRAVFAKAY
jgi:prolyl-tRNA synthetase